MTLYEIICDLAGKHCRIKGMGSTDQLKFDLTTKSIRCGKGYILQNGVYCVDWLDLTDGTLYLFDDVFMKGIEENPYEMIERMYEEYIISRPSVASSHNKGNFKAKTSDELTFEQLMEGKDRMLLQYKLEAFILLGSLKGIFEWENSKNWFWKSKQVPGLVLYKSWLLNEGGENETNR